MRSRQRVVGAIALAAALTAAACGGDTERRVPNAQAAPTAQASASDPPAPSPSPAAAAPTTAPAIAPGGLAVGQVAINGTTIDYVTVVPADFAAGDSVPVMLAMPPGQQDLDLTQSVVERRYMAEALARGWVVVRPAAPDSLLYFDGSEALIPGFLAWMRTWVAPEGGSPHLVGVSNGGISAFRIAAGDPTSIQSLLVFPGFARSDEDRAALPLLADIPVRLFVDSEDMSWIPAMQEAHDILLNSGADVTLEIFAGEGHIIESLSDGVRIFDELEATR